MPLTRALAPSPTSLSSALRTLSGMRINTPNFHASALMMQHMGEGCFVFILACYRSYYVKNHRVPSSLKGKALCLLKTQFAKKPKNPV